MFHMIFGINARSDPTAKKAEEPIEEAPGGTKCVLNDRTIRTRCILKLVGSAH
jgi:hypothetical protein